jgi:hypothetical protein
MARTSVLSNATHVDPEPGDKAVVALLRHAAGDTGQLVVRLPDGQEITLPDGLSQLLLASAEELADGHAVTVLASDTMLTPAEVGRVLGLSRPFIARLLDEDIMASQHLPGSRHRVVRLADVLQFQARRERRREGRRRINDAVEAAELPY